MNRLTGHFSDVDPRKLIQWCLYGSHTVLAHHQESAADKTDSPGDEADPT